MGSGVKWLLAAATAAAGGYAIQMKIESDREKAHRTLQGARDYDANLSWYKRMHSWVYPVVGVTLVVLGYTGTKLLGERK